MQPIRILLAALALALCAPLASQAQTVFGVDKIEVEKMLVKPSSELTIATAAVTVTGSHHTVDTESDAATDTLSTINGGSDGMTLILRAANDARTVTIDRTGNVQGAADVTLDDASDLVALVYDGTASKWTIAAVGASGGGGGGVTTFVNLTDTPSAFTSEGGNLVRVNSGETALEFVDGSTLYLTTTIGDYTADASPTTSADYLLFHDADAGTWDKILFDDLPGGGGGDTLPVVDTTGIAKGSGDATKIVRLEVDGITTGTTRVITMADEDVSLVPGATFLSATSSDYTTDASPTTASDFVIFYDTDAGTWDKVLIDDLPSGGGSTLPVADTTGIAKGSADATKIVRLEVDGITTGTTRVLTMADADISLVPGTDFLSAAITDYSLASAGVSDGITFFQGGVPKRQTASTYVLDQLEFAVAPTKGRLLAGNGTAWTALTVGTDGQVLKADSAQSTGLVWGSSAGGSAITFDIGDDGGNDSTDLTEIATSGDTNNIFTEPSADKMLIDVGQNWPTSDVAVEAQTGDSATSFFSSGTIETARLPSSIIYESEIDTAAEINALTTDEDFLVDSDLGVSVQDYFAGLNQIGGLTPAKGDVIAYNGSAWVNLGVGSNGQVLTADSAEAAGIKWAAGGGGSGSLTTIQEGDVGVGDADIVTLDFNGSDFDLSETPDTEVNVAIAAAITRDTEWDTLAEINAATTDDDAAGLAANNAFTGANDFSGGTLELPQGTTVTLSNTGEIAYDSSGAGPGVYGGFVAEVAFGQEINFLAVDRAEGWGSSGKILFANDAGYPTWETPTAANLGLGALAALDTVTTGQIAANAVTTDKIANGTITAADIGDAELAALGGLTSAANKIPYWTGSGTASNLDFLDQDDMSSNSATAVPSQQSVKAYVDAEIAAAGVTLPVADTVSIAEGSVDATKEVRFEVDGITTGTVRVLTMADQDIDLTPTSGSFQASDADLTDLADGTLTGSKVDVATSNGDVLDVTYTPTNYTPDATPAEASDVDDLAAHLKGIDTAIGSAGGGGGAAPEFLRLTADFATTSTSFGDVDNGAGDDLIFTVSANTVYRLEVVGGCSSAAVTDAFIVGINGPTANWVQGDAAYPNASNPAPYTYLITGYDDAPTVANGPGAVTDASFRMNVIISVGGTGGSLAVRLRSETGNTTTMKAGTVAVLTELAAH